jgi:ABC-type Fe3+ transport system permease subunit
VSRHEFDPSSLIAGILFLGIASRYLIEGFSGRHMSFPWAMPAVLTAIGLILLLRLIFHSRRQER